MATTLEVQTRFDSPPEEVFAAIAAIDDWSQWMPNLVGVEQLTDGAFGVGTKWRETRTMYGRDATEEFEVTACDRPHLLSMYVDGTKGASKQGEYFFDYRFEEVDGGTLMTLSGRIEMPSLIGRIMSKMMVRMFRKAIEKDNEALRRYVDGADA